MNIPIAHSGQSRNPGAIMDLQFVRQLFGRPKTARNTESASCKPSLENLEDRWVPATLVDLSTAGASHTVNGAILTQTPTQPTGTGVIHSFVRINPGGNTA